MKHNYSFKVLPHSAFPITLKSNGLCLGLSQTVKIVCACAGYEEVTGMATVLFSGCAEEFVSRFIVLVLLYYFFFQKAREFSAVLYIL